MVIGFYLKDMLPGKMGGVEQYTRNLISCFSHNHHECVLFLNRDAKHSFDEFDETRIIPINISGQEDTALPYYIAAESIDVLFCPLTYIPHVEITVPIVSTICDLLFLLHPEYFSQEDYAHRKEEMAYTVKNADFILTISEYSKKTIIDAYSLQGSKIVVTYLAADKSVVSADGYDENVSQGLVLPEKYIVYPANSWPHKNHIRLIEAFDYYIEKYKDKDAVLVLTGNISEQIRTRIETSKYSKQILVFGYIDQQDMKAVLQNAQALVFPSLFEGFGIPLLEAMECDIPVTCSRSASIPEVAGDAALFFEGTCVNSIGDAIHHVLSDNELRTRLIENGRKRVELFSFARTACETENVFKKMISMKKTKSYAFQKARFLIYIVSDGDDEKVKNTIRCIEDQSDIEVKYVIVDSRKQCTVSFDERGEDLVYGILQAGNTVYADSLLHVWIQLERCDSGLYIAATDDTMRRKLIGMASDPKYKDFAERLYPCVSFSFFKEKDIRCLNRAGILTQCFLWQYQLYEYFNRENSIVWGNVVLGKS